MILNPQTKHVNVKKQNNVSAYLGMEEKKIFLQKLFS
jgi:hypothetical protein